MPVAGSPRPIRIALLGCGVVGTEVARLITDQAADLAARVGAPLELVGIAVRNVDAPRDSSIDRALLTANAEALVARADVVVELMGGIEPARGLLLAAIGSGASVVTANKQLLAEDGPTLYRAADGAGVDVYYEAAVAGAIPIVRPLRESLAGDKVRRVLGVVNGTTNYVLDKMASEGLDLEEVVKQAQALGYAEADPTADVEGFDAAAKAAIIASLAFHTRVTLSDVYREGITSVTAADMAWARQTGHVVKLLAVAEATDDGIVARVHPALLPADHPLAGVRGAYNAVFVEAEAAGELMFFGRGAGGVPTASAVLGDVVSAARHRVLGGKSPEESTYADLPVAEHAASRTRFQVRLLVDDRSGVLTQVAGVFAAHDVSIENVRQVPDGTGGADDSDGEADRQVAELLITTHLATESAFAATVREVSDLGVVREVTSILRVEGV